MAPKPARQPVDYLWLFFGMRGRLSRYPFFLANMLVSLVGALPFYKYVLAQQNFWSGGFMHVQFWETASTIALLAAFWPMFTLGAKRFQDLGRPGIYALVMLVPVLSIVGFVALCLMPGQPGPNRYGARTNAPA